MAEPRPRSTAEAALPVPKHDLSPDLALALQTVAERLGGLENPYADHKEMPPPLLRSDPAPLPLEPNGERRWFQMEDSGDWMGARLNGHATLGLSVDFSGPAEEPESTRKIISIRGDPYHPRYVLTTAGITIRF